MGNKPSVPSHSAETIAVHSKSLDAFNSCSACIPPRFKQILDRMLEKSGSDLNAWIALSLKLTRLEICTFISLYMLKFGSDSLALFLEDLASFANLYPNLPQYTQISHASLSRHLLASTQYSLASNVDDLLNITQPNFVTPLLQDYARWSIHPLIHSLLSHTFDSIFHLSTPPALPLLDSPSQFISRDSLIVFNTHIISKQKTWRLAYSSARDGHSWNAFVAKVESCGAVLVLLSDSNGGIFGGYTSTPLEKDDQSFLVKVEPELDIYLPTGQNENHIYFNYQTLSYPNGLGFGGQLDYFGLWIDAGFLSGHSRGSPSSTFGNMPLTGEVFTLDSVEVWCVEEREVDERLVGSIVGHVEAKALLEMSGKAMWSDAV